MLDQSSEPTPGPHQNGWRGWTRNKKLLVGGGGAVLVALFAIGLLAGPRQNAPQATRTPSATATASLTQASPSTTFVPPTSGIVYTIEFEAAPAGADAGTRPGQPTFQMARSSAFLRRAPITTRVRKTSGRRALVEPKRLSRQESSPGR